MHFGHSVVLEPSNRDNVIFSCKYLFSLICLTHNEFDITGKKSKMV